MRKSFFLISLSFIFVLLFMPKDTYAKSSNMFPNWVQAYNNTSRVIDQEPAGWALYNHNYHTFVTSSDSVTISSINWIYENKWTFDLNKNYDISFRIYQPNVGVSSLSGFNAGKPLVSFENKACYVDYTSSNTSTSNVYGSTFNVICENVSLNSTTFHIYVDTGPMNTSSTLFGNRYGIGQNWDITLSNDNSTLESAINENTQVQEEIKDSITDSNVDDAENSASSFFDDFTTDDYGLSDIITVPLSLIQQVSSTSCEPLQLPLPFVDETLELPCLQSIFSQYASPILTLYQVVTFGLIAYYVIVRIFNLVKDFKNPDHDEIEVMEL